MPMTPKTHEYVVAARENNTKENRICENTQIRAAPVVEMGTNDSETFFAKQAAQ